MSLPAPQPKPGIRDIAPYVPGKSHVEGVEDPIKLSSNENILGCSVAAREAFVEAASKLHIYPDGSAKALRAAIADHFQLEPERLFFGCGSDEIFGLICAAFLEPGDNIVQGEFAFATYAIAARAQQAEIRNSPQPNLRLNVDNMLDLVDERTRLVFLANPDNPSSTYITSAELRRLHEGLPPDVLLVIDGAYVEFARAFPDFEDGLDLARTAQNILVTRTFSKMHGLAALRVGWAYTTVEIVDALNRIRPAFNVNLPAQAAAIAALGDEDFQNRSVELVERWRPWLTQQIGGLGLEVTPSATNFVVIRFPERPGKTALDAEHFLAQRGWLTRALAGYGMPDRIRINVGLEDHNRAVVEALAEFMSQTR
jgi:histidinol-phosphate aminotransferase